MILCYLVCLTSQLWELRRYHALGEREVQHSLVIYLQKKKRGADDAIYFVSLSVLVRTFLP